MKFSFTFFFLLLLAIISKHAHSQSRVDAALLKLDSVSQDIPNVKSWIFVPATGKWDGDGGIPKFVRWAVFTHKGQKYHAFIYRKISGFYKYPHIKEGYTNTFYANFIIFKEKEFQDIINKLNNKSGKNINIKSYNNGSVFISAIDSFNEATGDVFLKALTDVMNKSIFSKRNEIFPLNSQTVDGVDVVRFGMPANPETEDYSIKTAYYEAPFSDFINTMIMK
ncbi:hypothetical protein FPZ43_12795 [Mucilaginibacter pallidiroseus]|uniref:Uncharacterized protein n=1 Tax=Mucilaginibacter pallidiroseus TaxID=2599295 RepID=A0A563U7M9_9SPHI|nr:hypothetical protein [Mucilaginibacter pallidiroseus]TWR27357.1 hypothetical protein FPZ43_12795 [Mucilaginibacter pallidiroseus]